MAHWAGGGGFLADAAAARTRPVKARAARGKGDDSRARSSGKEVMEAGVDQVHGGAQAATGSVPGGERERRA